MIGLGAKFTGCTCIFDSNLNILKITNLGSQTAGTTLTYTSDSFKNPFDGKIKTGFAISTTDQSGAEINYSATPL